MISCSPQYAKARGLQPIEAELDRLRSEEKKIEGGLDTFSARLDENRKGIPELLQVCCLIVRCYGNS